MVVLVFDESGQRRAEKPVFAKGISLPFKFVLFFLPKKIPSYFVSVRTKFVG
jgi:hypothetical protein